MKTPEEIEKGKKNMLKNELRKVFSDDDLSLLLEYEDELDEDLKDDVLYLDDFIDEKRKFLKDYYALPNKDEAYYGDLICDELLGK